MEKRSVKLSLLAPASVELSEEGLAIYDENREKFTKDAHLNGNKLKMPLINLMRLFGDHIHDSNSPFVTNSIELDNPNNDQIVGRTSSTRYRLPLDTKTAFLIETHNMQKVLIFLQHLKNRECNYKVSRKGIVTSLRDLMPLFSQNIINTKLTNTTWFPILGVKPEDIEVVQSKSSSLDDTGER